MTPDLPWSMQIPVRYRDLDGMGHVNNAVYATYLEQARLTFFGEVLAVPYEEREIVVASMTIEFERPVEFADEFVTVAVGVGEIGDSSIRLVYEVSTDVEVVATGETVQVAYDSTTGGPRSVPTAWSERFAPYRVADT